MLASELPEWMARIVGVLFGAIWGSFFNVAIHRWPHGLSVIHPPSHCPHCGERIPARHNIPILSWLLLRGRAACCGATIPSRYFLVELSSAALCLALVERLVVRAPGETLLLHAGLEALVYFAFAGGLLVATFVDLEYMEIPDEVSMPGAALGLLTAPMRGSPGAEAAALGAGGGFLVVQLLFVWTYERLTGRRGMGEGDAKLLMMIGAFVGWKGVLFALVAGSAQGLLVALVALATGKRIGPAPSDDAAAAESTGSEDGIPGDGEAPAESESDSESDEQIASRLKVPFGPFLALGALEFLFFGPWVLDRYFALFAG
jgi:leader peptidase (prepilin peptidase)/N-methyltransferase